jgi:predicted ATPase
MELISFSVSNFRSITGSHKVAIKDLTVILGKNNEGKSNILRALNLAMRELTAHGQDLQRPPTRSSEGYIWKRDFPVSLQDRKRPGESVFRLEFALDADEVTEFRSEIKSALNGTLPISIVFRRTGAADIHVPKRGPGGNTLSAKSSKIAKYIAQRISFNYIPAIRTEDESLTAVQEMLSAELGLLETNDDYLEALQKIADLQQPILDRVSATIKESLSDFLPNIRNVSVRIPQSARRTALRTQCRVEIDDGSPTLLEYKGDGVKSLAALGLLKDRTVAGGVSIIAIEEPESHLHPGAMHSLREVISKMAKNNQVVLTTHCPLFVDRDNVSSNVIIDSNSAKAAKDIASIRRLLGVRASDNLVNAGYVLVVEGDEDVIALSAILSNESAIISKALKQRNLVIEPIGGAGNLSYKLTLLSNALCITHVLLDNDPAGKSAFEKAEAERTLAVADVTFVNCRGMPASELEDCFAPDLYRQRVLDEFDVDLSVPAFRGNAKWSDRARACFEAQGKPWNTKMEAQLKAVVAEAVAAHPEAALHAHKRGAIDALKASLERKLATVD